MTWIATAYRWGWTNNHQYIVYAGEDYDRALELAEEENSDRGGKYGVALHSYTEDYSRLFAYFPSSYGEKMPEHNYRLDYLSTLGHMMEEYINGKVTVTVPHDEFPNGVLGFEEIEPDHRLVERAASKKKMYDEMQRLQEERNGDLSEKNN